MADLTHPGDERGPLKTWIAVDSAIIGAFMAVLNIQITNASLPDIEGGIVPAASMVPGRSPPI